jgi:haloacetate dehalogenase
MFAGFVEERVVVGPVELRVRHGGRGLYHGDPVAMGAENHADWRAAVHDPAVVRAMLEDYRAGLGPDRAADGVDRAAGRRITCPTLVLWSTRDDLKDLYGDVLSVWRPWAPTLTGGAIDSGHHVAEEAPDELAMRLLTFLHHREQSA